MNGKLKWWNKAKKIGMMECDGVEYQVTIDDVNNPIEGRNYDFDEDTSKDYKKATNAKITELMSSRSKR